MDFEVHTQKTAPEASRELIAGVQQTFGFLPNVLGELAAAPAALEGAVRLLSLMNGSSLAVPERWVVLLETAYQNSSGYCVAANSTVASMQSVPGEIIEAVRSGKPLGDPKLEALRQLTGEMVRERGRVSAGTLKRFREAGFRKEQLFEVVLGIATETMASYTDRSTQVPMDEQFKPFAWKAA